MAKVTIVLEDTESGFSIGANFDQPGVPSEEMEANPTLAVAAGLAAARMASMLADRIEGDATNDDGSPLAIESVLGAPSAA